MEGEIPAAAARASSVGKRARASPISASRVAARTVPERGRLVNTVESACAARACSMRCLERGDAFAQAGQQRDQLEGDGLAGVGGRALRAVRPVPGAGGRAAGAGFGCSDVCSAPCSASWPDASARASGRGAGSGSASGMPGRSCRRAVEQPDRAGVCAVQVRAELVVRDDPGFGQVGAGADQHPQPDGGRSVDGERGQAAAVGVQDVGEQVGVEAVVLVAGGAVAGAQCGDLSAGDDEHGQAGVEQGLDDRSVAAFDGDPGDLVAVQQGDQLAIPSAEW